MKETLKKVLLSLSLVLCSLPGARADEGMWLIQSLDRALEKNMKARGLKLGVREIYNEEAGGLSDAVVSLGFYCTGSMISEDGLLITNHHCAYSQVAALSTPDHNYLEDGFWAQNRSQEIPLKGETFYFLRKVLDVTDEVEALRTSLLAEGKPAGSRRLSSLMEKKYRDLYGMEAALQSMWAGSKYYLCLYNTYTDVRLVGAPPVSVAAFGGDEDNWEWPQHKADFALYRSYTDDGEPLHPTRHLKISRKGYKEGDYAMVIGYPGSTQRYASAAQITQDIFVERRREWEEGLRACSPDNARLLDQLEAEYTSIAEVEKQKMYYRESLIRSFLMARTLMRMGSVKEVETQQRFLLEGLRGADARLEKEMLAFSVREFLTHMQPKYLKPIHLELKERFGEDFQAMAGWLWEQSCLRDMGIKPDAEVAAQYTGPITQDPLYRYIRELSIVELNEDEVLQVPLSTLRHQYVQASYLYRQSLGTPQYPDANSTMRLTYGRVLPLEPWDGVRAHWQSTARGLREKYDPARHDFAYPEAFARVLPPPDFPVNFLTDLDITGGNSGSPVLNARGELIGLAFDGNKESLASNYESVPGYNMCVCVDIRYVLWVIRHLGQQTYVLQELGL